MAKKQTRAQRKSSAPKAAKPPRPFSVEGLSEGVPKPGAKAAPKPMSGSARGMKLSSPRGLRGDYLAASLARVASVDKMSKAEQSLPKPATKAAAAAPKPARSAVRPVKAGTGIMAEPLSAKAVRNMPRKNAAPKPPAPKAAAPAPKAAKAPKFSSPPLKGSDVAARKTPRGQQAQMRNLGRRVVESAKLPAASAVKPSTMARMGRAAMAGGRSLLRPKMGGLIGAALTAGSAGYDAYRAFNEGSETPKAAPKAMPKPSPSAKPSPSPTRAKSAVKPSPSPSRTPSPRPTPFVQSPEFGKQNEFLTKLSDKSYKRTADEQKAYDSIMKARANPGSGLVGAKIVGRKTVGPKKPGSKKM